MMIGNVISMKSSQYGESEAMFFSPIPKSFILCDRANASTLWALAMLLFVLLTSMQNAYANNWSWGNHAPAGTNGLWVVQHINGEMVIGGNSGSFALQRDGYTTWEQPPQYTSHAIMGIAWNGLIYVAVSYGGSIFTSSDKVHWQTQSTDTTKKYRDIIWTGNQFVAVGENGVIVTSADGKSWALQNSATNQNLYQIAWNGSTIVATGSLGNVFTSVDGVTWTARNTGATGWLWGILWDGSQFIAVGASGTVVTSADAVTWTRHTWGTTNLYDLAFNGTAYVAVGDAGHIQTSSDLVNWYSQPFALTNNLRAIEWTGSAFMAVGDYGIITTSTTGSGWAAPYMNYNSGNLPVVSDIVNQSNAGLNTVATDGYSTFVAAGSNSTVMYSKDGKVWQQVSSANIPIGGTISSTSIISIIYDGSQFVLVGGTGSILTSVDGHRWRQVSQAYGYSPVSLTQGNGNYLILRDLDEGSISSDLVNWTAVKLYTPKGIIIPTINSYDGIWDGTKFIRVGSNYLPSPSVGVVSTSYDGITWIDQVANAPYALNSIAWNGRNKYIAVGKNGSLVTSSDGTTWSTLSITGLGNDLKKIRWLDSRFWIVGTNGLIMSSADGLNWQYEPWKTTNTIYDIASMNGTIVAVGATGTILVRDPQVVQDIVAPALITMEDSFVSQQVGVSNITTALDSYSYTVVQQPSSGTVSLDRYGMLTYSPYSNFFGNDQFRVQMAFGHQVIASIQYPVVVLPVNDPPTTTSQLLSTQINIDVYGKIMANDVDRDPLNYILLSNPSMGSLSINQNDGSFVYTPNRDQYGNDGFSYLVSDGITTSTMGFVNIDVTPPPDVVAPILSVGNPGGTFVGGASVTVTTNESATVYYTVDGTIPLVGSGNILNPNNPLTITTNTTVTLLAVDKAGNKSVPITEVYNIQLDSDSDGMPDWWETKYNLNPQSPMDRQLDPDGDGIVNIDEFLNDSNPLVSNIGASIHVTDQYVQPGQPFILPVTITPNTGTVLSSFHVVISYDSYAFTRGGVSVSGVPADWSYSATDSPITPDGFKEVVIVGATNTGSSIASPFSLYLTYTAGKNLVLGDRYSMTVQPTGFAITDLQSKVVFPKRSAQMFVANNMFLSIPLKSGWNFIGIPIAMKHHRITDLFSKITGMDSVWTLNRGSWQVFMSGMPPELNTLDTFDAGKAYWVKMSGGLQAQSLNVSGAATASFLPNTFVSGWNMLSVDHGVNSIDAWLSSIGGSSLWSYDGVRWQSFIVGSPIFLNSLNSIQPERGYYIRVP